MQVQSVPALTDQNSLLCKGDLGCARIADVGKKHSFPDCRALGALHVANVEHHLGKAFVENARLDLKRNLGAFQLVLQAGQGFLSMGREIDAVSKSKQPSGKKKDGEDAKEMPNSDAAGLHGCDFAVGGETPQADQYADQNSGGQGYG